MINYRLIPCNTVVTTLAVFVAIPVLHFEQEISEGRRFHIII